MASDASRDESRTSLRNAFKIAALSSALTLAGVVTTNITSWIGTAQATRSSEKLSCINRLDKQEDYARSKSDLFITTLAALAAGSASPGFAEKKAAYVEDFSKAGYSLMLLNDTEFGVTTGKLTDFMTTNVLDYKSIEKPPFDKEKYEKLAKAWKVAYYEFIYQLEVARDRC